MAEIEHGTTGTATMIVQQSDLASMLAVEPGEAYPPVLATSRMIALMEIAAARLLRPLQAPGELSAGVLVDVTHTAATPQGIEVTARARFVGREGKLFVFEVSASDPGGEIGRGLHKRAIVREDRLLEGAARRRDACEAAEAAQSACRTRRVD